jgi:PAS domain S-box-containing protein
MPHRDTSFFRHPVAVGIAAACVIAVLGLNVTAFVRGEQSPWLLGSVAVTDMLAVAVGILIAIREVMVADKRSDTSEAQLASIVEWSDDAIIGKSLDGTIRSWNRGAERIFGYTEREALGKHITLIIPEARHAEEDQVIAQIRRGETVSHFETVRRTKDGSVLDISLTVSPIRDAEGRVVGASKVARDITSRKKAEQKAKAIQSMLTGTQARLAAIVDSAMDAMITIDESQKIVLFNGAAEKVFQVPREHALGSPLERFLPQRFRAAHRGHVEQFGHTGVTNRRMGDVTTLWGLRADGEEFPIEASISQAGEAGERYFTVILRDITLRKQNEDTLLQQQAELRELSARVLEAREEEKTRIARELHDELGQLLTALKMDLAWIRERLPREGDLVSKADEMGRMLDQTVSSTRRISADLRPLMLDDLGLADAASWLVDDFARRSGVQCEMRLAGNGSMMDVDKRVATAVYRALQESLTNIARHSGASHAWILLAVENGRIEFEVEDDGRGIGTDDLAKSRSLGLKGMRERVLYFGGSLEVAAAPRGGTRIRGHVPAQPPAERATA